MSSRKDVSQLTFLGQHFYNIPINDPLRQDLDFDYQMINKVHDALGAADCIGSGYLVRREALSSIGGFPTFSVAEDIATSSMIVSAGWKVISLDEHIQCGKMSDSMLGHIKQRVRWVSKHNFHIPPIRVPSESSSRPFRTSAGYRRQLTSASASTVPYANLSPFANALRASSLAREP